MDDVKEAAEITGLTLVGYEYEVIRKSLKYRFSIVISCFLARKPSSWIHLPFVPITVITTTSLNATEIDRYKGQSLPHPFIVPSI